MTDRELEQKLKSARIPNWSDEYWETFPHCVKARLNHPASEARGRRIIPRLLWGAGLGFACALLVFSAWRNRSMEKRSYAFLQDENVIRETLRMFPNQVRAIVQDENGVRMVLSEKADVPDSPPIWIKICNGKECRVVITFSGQSFEVAKEKVEVLADAQGAVMLVGNQFFWSVRDKTAEIGHLRIQARPVAML